MTPENLNSGKKKAGRSSPHHPSSTRRGKSWFLGIGINQYQSFPLLNNAVKDVNDILSILKEKYGLSAENIITLFDELAIRANIIDVLHDLVNQVGETEKLLIYYSGHGHLDKKADLGYWIPQDALIGKSSGYIPNSTIIDYLKSINSKHTLLISDACFAGKIFLPGVTKSGRALEEMEYRRSRWGLVSGRHDQEVFDGTPGTNSPFAASIIEVLTKNKNKLNVAKLADDVVKMTRAKCNQLPEGNPLHGVGHDGGQYVFKLVENKLWEKSHKEFTIPSFENYLNNYPEGPHVNEALRHINDLALQREIENRELQINTLISHHNLGVKFYLGLTIVIILIGLIICITGALNYRNNDIFKLIIIIGGVFISILSSIIPIRQVVLKREKIVILNVLMIRINNYKSLSDFSNVDGLITKIIDKAI